MFLVNSNPRMKWIFCFFILTSTQILSQDVISLKSKKIDLTNVDFYIKEVIDNREEKNLGIVKNKEGTKAELRLFPNAEEVVDSFIKISIPKLVSNKAIIIKIKDLNIQESRISESEVIARAFVHLVFYEKRRNRLKEIFRIKHKEDQVFEASIFTLSNVADVFNTHEKRIRAALEYCLFAFMENQKDTEGIYSKHFESLPTENENKTQLDKWYNIITYRHILTSTYHEGWAVGYTGFLDSDKGFIIPYEINFEQYRVKGDFTRERGFEYLDSYMLRPGLYGYKKVIPSVYGALGINIPIGIEAIKEFENNEYYKFLIGIGASQGIKIIPWKNFGFVFGVEFFQQIQNSEIYTTDIGFELILGINF